MWRSPPPLMEDSPLPAPRPSTRAIHGDQQTKPRVGKSVLQFRELGKVKTEMEQLKIAKPTFVIQPRLEKKQEEEEEEELEECFFDALNNLGLSSPAPPSPRPSVTAALPPPTAGLPSSQDFPSSPGLPSSTNSLKAHLPSFPTSSPELPSSSDLPFSPTSSPTFSQDLSSSPVAAASPPPPQAPESSHSPRESDLRILPTAKPSLGCMPLPPRPALPKALLDSTSSPCKTPSTPRRHKLLPMKILSNMLDTAVDSDSTVDLDTPTKAVTFTEVHRSDPSRQQINPRSVNKAPASVPNASSYDMTPARHELPPAPLADQNNYGLEDLQSDEDTDDEENPRKEIPRWAEGSDLRTALLKQTYMCPDLDKLFDVIVNPNLADMFSIKRKRFDKRTSSADWDSTPGSFMLKRTLSQSM